MVTDGTIMLRMETLPYSRACFYSKLYSQIRTILFCMKREQSFNLLHLYQDGLFWLEKLEQPQLLLPGKKKLYKMPVNPCFLPSLPVPQPRPAGGMHMLCCAKELKDISKQQLRCCLPARPCLAQPNHAATPSPVSHTTHDAQATPLCWAQYVAHLPCHHCRLF